jgi:hypothetical protein
MDLRCSAAGTRSTRLRAQLGTYTDHQLRPKASTIRKITASGFTAFGWLAICSLSSSLASRVVRMHDINEFGNRDAVSTTDKLCVAV